MASLYLRATAAYGCLGFYVVRHDGDLFTQLTVDCMKLHALGQKARLSASYRPRPVSLHRLRDMANDKKHLDGYASMAGESPFSTITPQPPPNDPRIKALLSRGLMEPETLTPSEVKTMTASLVYHLLSQGNA